MNDYVKAWQCIGCGKIEAPQTCIGVCQDRKVLFVHAEEHEQMLAELAAARQRVNALEALIETHLPVQVADSVFTSFRDDDDSGMTQIERAT